jgi:hypothetical protein
MTIASNSERAAASAIANLGGVPCSTFAPGSTTYHDAEGIELTGKPDYRIRRGTIVVNLEWKAGKLNNHYTRSSSHAGLQRMYSGPDQSYRFLTDYFWNNGYRSGKVVCLDHAFNQSLWKVLALQAEHGWRSYVVCFEANPKPEDAKRYCNAGLIWCTIKTLPQLLYGIELADLGLPLPFKHHTQKYSYEVVFDNSTATRAEMRMRFFEAVAENRALIDAENAQAAADEAAGILPF